MFQFMSDLINLLCNGTIKWQTFINFLVQFYHHLVTTNRFHGNDIDKTVLFKILIQTYLGDNTPLNGLFCYSCM